MSLIAQKVFTPETLPQQQQQQFLIYLAGLAIFYHAPPPVIYVPGKTKDI